MGVLWFDHLFWRGGGALCKWSTLYISQSYACLLQDTYISLGPPSSLWQQLLYTSLVMTVFSIHMLFLSQYLVYTCFSPHFFVAVKLKAKKPTTTMPPTQPQRWMINLRGTVAFSPPKDSLGNPQFIYDNRMPNHRTTSGTSKRAWEGSLHDLSRVPADIYCDPCPCTTSGI